MPRTNPTYPPEFRREAIRLVRTSDEEHPIPGIAREIGVSDGTLRNWVNQDEIDSGERAGLTTEEKEEFRKLRREVKTLRQEKEILRKAWLRPPWLSSPERRSGVGERFQAHRCGEGQLLGSSAAQDARSLQERLLRLEMQAALQEEPPGLRPHGEDPRGSPQEPRDLRLPAGARRAARPGCAVRSAQGGPANAGRGASGLHARQEAWNHPPRPEGCSRTGSAWQGLRGRSAQSRIWLADITYVPTQEGFLYLAFILDAHSGASEAIVGWSMASHMKTELVVDALQMAVWRRKPSAGLVHHSDRGSQYTAISFGKRLEEVGLVPSMGRTGTALDNAMAESFVATLKAHRRQYTCK